MNQTSYFYWQFYSFHCRSWWPNRLFAWNFLIQSPTIMGFSHLIEVLEITEMIISQLVFKYLLMNSTSCKTLKPKRTMFKTTERKDKRSTVLNQPRLMIINARGYIVVAPIAQSRKHQQCFIVFIFTITAYCQLEECCDIYQELSEVDTLAFF